MRPKGLSAWHKEVILELHGIGARTKGIAKYIGRAEKDVVAFLEEQDETNRPEPRFVSKGHDQYREGFAAGYRLALAHAKLHGKGSAHEHWWHVLTPWIRGGLDDRPPGFLRMHGRR